jgi:hypothetical protein
MRLIAPGWVARQAPVWGVDGDGRTSYDRQVPWIQLTAALVIYVGLVYLTLDALYYGAGEDPDSD